MTVKMDLKHLESNTINVSTYKSIWERLPYNVGMELHTASNATTTTTTTTITTRAEATTINKSGNTGDQHAAAQLQQQQQLLHYSHNPPQITPTTATTTITKRIVKKNTHCQTLECQQQKMATLLPITMPDDLQQRQAATCEYNNILQQQQQQKQQQHLLLPMDSNFPLDISDNENTATKLFSTKIIAASTNATTTMIKTAAETTNTRTAAAATLRQSGSKKNNNNGSSIGDNSELTTTAANKNINFRSNVVVKLPLQALLLTLQQLPENTTTCVSIALRRIALLLLMLNAVTHCWAGRQDALSNCTFPARWEGSWFLSGYQQSIHIKGSQFSYRGKCAASDGNKYLIVDEKGCHRCLVIYEKHKNVLQYKESECEGDSMYLHQTNPSAMAMRSVLKQSGDHSRAGAHPNLNGHSRLSSSDQYIMRSNDDMNDCPSDFCKGRETLQNLCDQIPGDALLYSLFRESAEPVKCPLKGPFVFTYNRGHGECKSPLSNIDSCTEDSRLLLSFQACPDVQGTESTVEELTCLATWKDGNSRYLVGLVSHHHAISNEERYRCFVYEKISSLMGGLSITNTKDAEYKLAQSGDATCNGLDSAEVGSRIMSLRKPPPAERCDFPAWFKGPRHWHALMGNAVYNYHANDGSMHIIKSNGYMETRALCEQINKQTATEMMAVVHYTTGCQSGFMCMMFYRRDTHVIEIQSGKQASRLEDACAPDHFDINRMPYITLLANNPDPQICPLEGLYNLRGAIGPPHISARHKRNHNNNKAHAGHAAQHQQHHLLLHAANDGNAAAGGNGGDVHKRHSSSNNNNNDGSDNTFNYRNSERVAEHSSWNLHHNEGHSIRRRHAAAAGAAAAAATTTKGSLATFNADMTKKPNKFLRNHNAAGNAYKYNNIVAANNVAAVAADAVTFEMATDRYLLKLTMSNDNHDSNNSPQQQQLVAIATAKEQQIITHNTKLQRYALTAKSATTAATTAATIATATDATARTKALQVVGGIINAAADGNDASVVVVVDKNAPTAARDNNNSSSSNNNNSHVSFVETQQRSRRDAPGCVVNYKAQRQLLIGCTAPNLIDVRPQCNEDGDEEYSCHGSWSENGTVYVIARHKGSKHGVCISYRPLEGNAAQLFVGDACYRGAVPPIEHPLVANLTLFGKCGDPSAAPQSLHSAAFANYCATLAALLAASLLINRLSPTAHSAR